MYMCPVGECTREFPTYRHMIGHMRKALMMQDLIETLTVTNQCMFCMGSFTNKRLAALHVRNVLSGKNGGVCRSDKDSRRSWWATEVHQPESLTCPLCAQDFSVLHHLQVHLRTHLEHPAYLELEGPLPSAEQVERGQQRLEQARGDKAAQALHAATARRRQLQREDSDEAPLVKPKDAIQKRSPGGGKNERRRSGRCRTASKRRSASRPRPRRSPSEKEARACSSSSRIMARS